MKKGIIISAAIGLAATVLAVIPAYAQTGTRGSTSLQQRISAMQARGAKEIDSRVTNLGSLISRLQQMRNLSDAQKSSIVATIQNLISNLNTLKTQINSDTSTTSLKNDDQAITQNYRVYALVMPQLNIVAAADRIITIDNMMSIVGSKLQSRLTQESNISNISALQAALSDMSAKLADAKSQAQAAVSEVTPLVPDQGDKTKMAANTATLKNARTKIQAAQKDLTAARKDASTIIAALVKADRTLMNGSRSSASTTPSSTATSTH